MSKSLPEIRDILLEGQRRSDQGSYERRQPASEAMPLLIEARSDLQAYVAEHRRDEAGWRLLSNAEECLLDYRAARRSLEQAMSLSGRRGKQDLKRLALLTEYESQWTDLALSPAQLEELGNYLQVRFQVDECDHTRRFTTEWVQAAYRGESGPVIDALDRRGAFCDCQVLNNLVRG